MARRRLRFFHFLETDAPEWFDEQEYHRGRLADYERALLGAGVLEGLQVEPNAPADLNVIVRPGSGVDASGYLFEVTADQVLNLAVFVPATGTQIVYIVAAYDQQPVDPVFVDETGQNEFARLLDTVAVRAQAELPMAPWIELARVELAAGATAITAAVDPDHPQANEIDRRYAVGVGGAFRARVVGLISDTTGVQATSETALLPTRWQWEPDRYPPLPRAVLEVVGSVGAPGERGEVRLYDETSGTVLVSVELSSTTPALVRSIPTTRLPAGPAELGLRLVTTSGSAPTTLYAARLIIA